MAEYPQSGNFELREVITNLYIIKQDLILLMIFRVDNTILKFWSPNSYVKNSNKISD